MPNYQGKVTDKAEPYAWIVIICAALLVLAGCAKESTAYQPITVEDAWARPGLAGGNSSVYLVINNHTAQQDTLLAVESEVADFAELHMTSMDAEGNMRMHHQESVQIASNSELAFKPGALHIMLIQLRQNLAIGDVVSLTLHFENSGLIEISAAVKQP